ncbi:uncharacterized protein EI97DRAFT_196925 [Westerdykella ornata]|uniref:Chitin-binding type-1 domain-containing protein n=1 Tax=Westerdykella ornata TaxID=318751 RepID=A0A6A6JB13_WESOR|nr:uncharacterized protein EI97DRAFT_196925 [Westerdykella ornata]KAF2272816.1 hypothetical protein EI97DRAFT_196925 [Westerdykella ornata]
MDDKAMIAHVTVEKDVRSSTENPWRLAFHHSLRHTPFHHPPLHLSPHTNIPSSAAATEPMNMSVPGVNSVNVVQCIDGVKTTPMAIVALVAKPKYGRRNISSPISPNGRAAVGTGSFVCPRSRCGDCCSLNGFCGSRSAYCSRGCQLKFGICDARLNVLMARVCSMLDEACCNRCWAHYVDCRGDGGRQTVRLKSKRCHGIGRNFCCFVRCLCKDSREVAWSQA